MSLLVTAAIWDERNFSPDELPSKESRASRELWIDGSTLLILQAIGDRADEKTGYAFPGNDELRRRGRLQTDRGVRLCVERLKRTGHVAVLIEAHGEGYPNFYQVLTGRPERKILRDLLDHRDGDGTFTNPQDADAYAALMAELREKALQWIMAKGFTSRLLPPAVRDTLVKPPRRQKNRKSSAGSERAGAHGPVHENRNSSAGSLEGQNGNGSSGSSDGNQKSSSGSGQQSLQEPEEPFRENRKSRSAPYMEEQSASERSEHLSIPSSRHEHATDPRTPRPAAGDLPRSSHARVQAQQASLEDIPGSTAKPKTGPPSPNAGTLYAEFLDTLRAASDVSSTYEPSPEFKGMITSCLRRWCKQGVAPELIRVVFQRYAALPVRYRHPRMFPKLLDELLQALSETAADQEPTGVAKASGSPAQAHGQPRAPTRDNLNDYWQQVADDETEVTLDP